MLAARYLHSKDSSTGMRLRVYADIDGFCSRCIFREYMVGILMTENLCALQKRAGMLNILSKLNINLSCDRSQCKHGEGEYMKSHD